MYSKSSLNVLKRHIKEFDEVPPEKKLISDADTFIKELSKKQLNREINLQEQLKAPTSFCSVTELVPIESSGLTNLPQFNATITHSNEIEKLKSIGLTSRDITLFLDYKEGIDNLKAKHKKVNEEVLMRRIHEILTLIENNKRTESTEEKKSNYGRLTEELISSMKPMSTETKLLKFALENKHPMVLPNAVDISALNAELEEHIAPISTSKIIRQYKALRRDLEELSSPAITEPKYKSKGQLSSGSKWDVKEKMDVHGLIIEKKVYTCKPMNFYTIKDNQIVKLNPANSTETVKSQISIEEIKQIPKFANYEMGLRSKILYLKNLANNTNKEDIEKVMPEFLENIVSIKVMNTGRMRGQAFLELDAEETSEAILNKYNGIFLRNKPIIMQYGKQNGMGKTSHAA